MNEWVAFKDLPIACQSLGFFLPYPRSLMAIRQTRNHYEQRTSATDKHCARCSPDLSKKFNNKLLVGSLFTSPSPSLNAYRVWHDVSGYAPPLYYFRVWLASVILSEAAESHQTMGFVLGLHHQCVNEFVYPRIVLYCIALYIDIYIALLTA